MFSVICFWRIYNVFVKRFDSHAILKCYLLSINNIICDPAGGPDGGRIKGCADSATQVESIYFGLAADFPGIAELGGMNYRSTITSVTSVPIPATAWLMLSGLSLIGSMALRRKSSAA